MRAFRTASNPTARTGVGRVVLALCLFAGVAGMWIPRLLLDLSGGTEQRSAFVFAGNLFLICLLLLMGHTIPPPLDGVSACERRRFALGPTGMPNTRRA